MPSTKECRAVPFQDGESPMEDSATGPVGGQTYSLANREEQVELPARDSLGRLLPGNTANPSGRPKQQAALLQAALRECTEDDVRAIFRRMIDLAEKKGSVKAAELVLGYAIGKPVQTREYGLSHADGLVFTIVRRPALGEED